MPQQQINIGTVENDGTGDTLREGGQKINANFTELYEGLADAGFDNTENDARLDALENDKADKSQFVTLTQAEYDALVVKDDNTFYFIPEA